MNRSFLLLKAACLLCILALSTNSTSAQRKGSIAYTRSINGSDVVICPVRKGSV